MLQPGPLDNLFWRLAQANQESKLILPGDLVIVGLSAGRDSVFLFHYLNYLRTRINFELRVAHVIHGFRPEADLSESKFARGLAESADLVYYEKTMQLSVPSKTSGLGLEATARQARQAYFRKLVETAWIKEDRDPDQIKFALGHQKDDLAESVLLQISRGTGLSGLLGMRAREGFYVRPLLDLSRAELTAYLDQNSFSYYDDRTNQDPGFLRNAIRLELIPLWSEFSGRSMVDQLAKLAKNLEPVASVVDTLVKQKLGECMLPDGCLSRRRLLACRPDLQELVLRTMIRGQEYEHAPNRRQVQMILARLRQGGGRARFDLDKERYLSLDADRVSVEKKPES